MALILFVGTAQARTPLIQDGKKSVFQRVITHPGAQLFEGPEQDAPILRELVKTFTPMYIYDRKGNRLEVGVSSSQADGWINAGDVTVWPQPITILLTDRTGRAPVLFFRDHSAIDTTCRAPSVKQLVTQYAAQMTDKALLPADFPVVAMEAREVDVEQKNFYLLPLLDFDNQYDPVNLLKVAIINPGSSLAAQKSPNGSLQVQNDRTRLFVESTGYAMPLKFQDNQQGSMIPHVVYAWIADVDLEKAEEDLNYPIWAVESAVLLTKGQLRNLCQQLKLLLKKSEMIFLSSQDDFFDLFKEVLEDLPCESRSSQMTQGDWEIMSTGERDSFIRRIKGLLAHYEAYDKDETKWESLGSPNPNDWVSCVPFYMLP